MLLLTKKTPSVYPNNLSLDTSGCQYDYVEIFDGKSANAPNLGKYCGGNMPGPIRSSTNELYLRFISDQTVSHTGFVASYIAVSKGEHLKHFKTFRNTLFIPCHRKYSQSEYRKAVIYSTVWRPTLVVLATVFSMQRSLLVYRGSKKNTHRNIDFF